MSSNLIALFTPILKEVELDYTKEIDYDFFGFDIKILSEQTYEIRFLNDIKLTVYTFNSYILTLLTQDVDKENLKLIYQFIDKLNKKVIHLGFDGVLFSFPANKYRTFVGYTYNQLLSDYKRLNVEFRRLLSILSLKFVITEGDFITLAPHTIGRIFGDALAAVEDLDAHHLLSFQFNQLDNCILAKGKGISFNSYYSTSIETISNERALGVKLEKPSFTFNNQKIDTPNYVSEITWIAFKDLKNTLLSFLEKLTNEHILNIYLFTEEDINLEDMNSKIISALIAANEYSVSIMFSAEILSRKIIEAIGVIDTLEMFWGTKELEIKVYKLNSEFVILEFVDYLSLCCISLQSEFDILLTSGPTIQDIHQLIEQGRQICLANYEKNIEVIKQDAQTKVKVVNEKRDEFEQQFKTFSQRISNQF